MSRIEEALKKLQTRIANAPREGLAPHEVPAGSVAARALPVSPVPVPAPAAVPNKKVAVEGVKHHISQEALIESGLLAPANHPGSADEFRRIKRPIIANVGRGGEAGSRLNVIMIASPMPGAGKTFCTVNLAASIALERELNVLLVDADVAKPHISREFGLDGAPGLIDLLLDDTRDLADILVRTDFNDIQVLPAGRHHAHATELLASDRMTQIIGELASRYPDRIILLDSPPLLITSEAQALASQVGQIVLVVEAGKTSHQMLSQTLEVLDPTKAINILLNKARDGSVGRGYYYGGGYDHENQAQP